jgi:3-hydroxybutyryl-CoA dehydrogenase
MTEVKHIQNICVIGIGTLGKQIAERSALNNFKVNIFDVNSEGLNEFLDEIRIKLIENGSEGEIILFDRLADAVKNTDLVIESVPEDLGLKKKVFSQIDEAAPSHTIIATNSSSIPVSRIESAVERIDKVLNIHFYKLPDFPMADIVRGSKTSDETYEMGKQWLQKIKVTPLQLKKECLGFVFNRVWRSIKKECLKIWAGGYANLEEVDKAWMIFTGMSFGPFKFMDMIGLDVVYDIEMIYYKESGDPKDKPPEKLKEKIDKNELGVKSGKGFYQH